MRVYDRSRLKTRDMEAIYRRFRSPAAIGSKPEVMRNWILLAPPSKDDIAAIGNRPCARARSIGLRGWNYDPLGAAAVLSSSPGNDPDKVKSLSSDDRRRCAFLALSRPCTSLDYTSLDYCSALSGQNPIAGTP